MIACRLPQPRLRPGRGPAVNAHAYDPSVPSDGLTLDTPQGPVDLVAVWRALEGQRAPLTVADAHHAITLLPASHGQCVETAALGLGVEPASVQRAVIRHWTAHRTTTATTATETKDPR